MTEQLSVQMSWGNGGCTRAGSPGDQQSRELGPWAARRSRAMMRANAWGHDELKISSFKKVIVSPFTGGWYIGAIAKEMHVAWRSISVACFRPGEFLHARSSYEKSIYKLITIQRCDV